VVKVLRKETAFPRCRATDSRWNKKPVSLGSSVTAVILIIIVLYFVVSKCNDWDHFPEGRWRLVGIRKIFQLDNLSKTASGRSV